jgi:hypothetical protein
MSEKCIDFFCCNTGEILFYLPISKHLPNAKFVVLDSRYDSQRTKTFLEKHGIQYSTNPSENVGLVITTQTKVEPWTLDFWRNAPKIRLMYTLCEKNKMHQRIMCDPFHTVLVPGPYSHKLISKYTKSKMIGYPRFDDFFNIKTKKEDVFSELNITIDENKKTLLYLPTFTQYNRSSAPDYLQAIKDLSSNYNVLFKPHIYSDYWEKELIESYESGGIQLIHSMIGLDKLFLIADVTICDYQSGVPWECVITDTPFVVCLNKSGIPPKNLEKILLHNKIAPTVRKPEQMKNAIEECLKNHIKYTNKRTFWAQEICINRNGTSGINASQVLNNILSKSKRLTDQEADVLYSHVKPKKPSRLNEVMNKLNATIQNYLYL